MTIKKGAFALLVALLSLSLELKANTQQQWQALNLGETSEVHALSAAPHHHKTLYLALENGSFYKKVLVLKYHKYTLYAGHNGGGVSQIRLS